MKTQLAIRLEAAQAGQIHYKALKPCPVCGDPYRYTKADRCVTCEKARSKKVKDAERLAIKSAFEVAEKEGN